MHGMVNRSTLQQSGSSPSARLVGALLLVLVPLGGYPVGHAGESVARPPSTISPGTSARPHGSVPEPARASPVIPSVAISADSRHLIAAPASGTLAYVLDRNPDILFIDFADLASQAKTMNRLAAFLEKAHAPKGRVLESGELRSLIESTGSSFLTYPVNAHDRYM